MAAKKSPKKGMNRREFLKRAGTIVGGVAVGAGIGTGPLQYKEGR
ncbi:MAG: twin-arginine translocation signal domain-containing protein [Desulfobacterales bacterium]|nr:MAG: twin-arginine translocation signal domain-containing protein [Desulfobacterales bacterium]